MAYDLELANRLREALAAEPGTTEKAMFGGLAFLVNGHMAVTASRHGGLLLRVDPAETESLLSERHTTRFEMRGRELDGWLRIEPEAIETDDELQYWSAGAWTTSGPWRRSSCTSAESCRYREPSSDAVRFTLGRKFCVRGCYGNKRPRSICFVGVCAS
jgi:hypothetical protein